MPGPQRETTVHDHALNPGTHGQILMGVLLAEGMCRKLVELADDAQDTHPDLRNALLQRAAQFANGMRKILDDAREHAPPEQRDLFENAYLQTAESLAAASSRASGKPTGNSPEHPPRRYEHNPTPRDTAPNQYWRWLQRHVPALALASWLDDASILIAKEPPGTDTRYEITATAAHAVAIIGNAIDTAAEQPDDHPEDGMTTEQLQEIREIALIAAHEAREQLDELIAPHYRASEIRATRRAQEHDAVMRAAQDMPLSPNAVRTVVAPDHHPDGPVIGIIHEFDGAVHARLIEDPPPAQLPDRTAAMIHAMAMRHLALDHIALDTEPPESVRIAAIAVTTPAWHGIRALSGETAAHIIGVARHRGVEESAMRDAFTAACRGLSPNADRIMSDAGLNPQACGSEVFEAVARATLENGGDPHLVVHLAHSMHLAPHLIGIPRAITTPEQRDAVIAAARRAGVPERYITVYAGRTDDGTAAVFNPPPAYTDRCKNS